MESSPRSIDVTPGSRWDRSQQSIIDADPTARILVEAGPGSGKTAVACGRVEGLISSHGLDGNQILLLSFTNAAVHEMRRRVKNLRTLAPFQFAAVEITTIDSLAGRLRHAFEPHPEFSGFRENIRRFIALLHTGNGDVEAHLHSFRHVLIDEAQDVVGDRARALLQLVDCLHPECGVTVFCDSAQAIYGWTNDKSRSVATERPTEFRHELLHASDRFELRRLSGQYRIRDSILSDNLNQLRSRVMEPITEYGDYVGFVDEVRAAAGQEEIKLESLPEQFGGQDRSLLLFRTRASAIAASSYFCSASAPHRLRTSRLPLMLFPWVADVGHAHRRRRMTRADFEGRWKQLSPSVTMGWEYEDAWEEFNKVAGDPSLQGLDMIRLRNRLGRSRPPEVLLRRDVGRAGPILGTIHASKGREADRVLLTLPREDDQGGGGEDDPAWDEEARVLYVGATRPREELQVAEDPSRRIMSLDSGRAFRFVRRRVEGGRRLQVEVGLRGDVEHLAQTDPVRLGSLAQVQAAQKCLREFDGTPVKLVAKRQRSPEGKWRWVVGAKDGNSPDGGFSPFAVLSEAFNTDLWAIARHVLDKRVRPPSFLPFVYLVDVRSVLVEEDNTHLGYAAPPYQHSGCWLVPVLRGFSPGNFYYQ